jgi:polar amino acid transport system permease protein
MVLIALDLKFMWQIVPDILQASLITIEISTLAVLFGIVTGLPLGGLRVLGSPFIKVMIQGFVDFVRGVPPLLHIAFIYFALPNFGIRLDEFWTGVVALTIIAAGYEVEIVRAAIESIDRGQSEAALSIGMDQRTTLTQILLPQALKRMLPALTNELANVIKASSLLSVISVNELMKVGNALIFEHFVFAEVLIQVAIMYLVIISFLVWLSAYLEAQMFSFGGLQQSGLGAHISNQNIR